MLLYLPRQTGRDGFHRKLLQQALNPFEFHQQIAHFRAALQHGFRLGKLIWRKLAIQVLVDKVLEFRVVFHRHTKSKYPFNSSRSAILARNRRLFMVPNGSASKSAICW